MKFYIVVMAALLFGIAPIASGVSALGSIKISPEQAKDEVDFWARQMSEHALFLSLGLEVPELKQRGTELHKRWEEFRNNYTSETIDEVFPLLDELKAFKTQVLQTLMAGDWIGWIYPRFAQHVLLELKYFVDKLNGRKMTDDQEAEFWNTINGDHAGFDSHLLDPTERALVEQADALSKRFQTIKSENEMFIQISLYAAHELDQFHKTAKKAPKGAIKSIIHPALLEHVIREGERGIQTLTELESEQAKKTVQTIRNDVQNTKALVEPVS